MPDTAADNAKPDPKGTAQDIQKRIRRALDETLADYERENADGLLETFSELAHRGLVNLRRLIEDPNEPDVTWDAPFVELRYPVKLGTGEDGFSAIEAEEPEKRDELVRQLIRAAFEEEHYRILRTLTNGVAWIKRSGDFVALTVSEELEKALAEIPAESREDVLEELFLPLVIGGYKTLNPENAGEGLVVQAPEPEHLEEGEPEEPEEDAGPLRNILGGLLPLEFAGKLGDSRFSGSVVIVLNPLVVDEDARSAYFPLVVGLEFHIRRTTLPEGGDLDQLVAERPDPSTWTDEERRTFWETLIHELNPETLRANRKKTHAQVETGLLKLSGFPVALAPSPERRYLLDQPTRLDRRAADLLGHIDKLHLPRRWRTLRRWDELVQEEIARIREDIGDEAFEDLRKKTNNPDARGALLRRLFKPSREELVELTPEAEESLIASVGYKGFRRRYRDPDGISREYLVKRFQAGSGYAEVRLSWYGESWPFVTDGPDEAGRMLEEVKRRREDEALFNPPSAKEQEEHAGRFRWLNHIRDARIVMEAILSAFGRDGMNPLPVPAWQLRTLLECESDVHGFERIRGCLRALQEVRFVFKAVTGEGYSPQAFGPFLGEVVYIPRGAGRHTDGTFYLQITADFVGSLRVFQTATYRIRDARKLLLLDFGKTLSKEAQESLRYLQGFSALAVYYDQAKGFTPAQSNLRRWLGHNLTFRKDGAGSRRKHLKAKGNAADAHEPRLYGRDFCPLLEDGKLYEAALGHYTKNAETGFKLFGTPSGRTKTGGAHTQGLLDVLGYTPLPPGRALARREEIVRTALQDFRAVVEEAFEGLVVGKQGNRWFRLAEATGVRVEELLKDVRWTFFLPRGWRDRLAGQLEDYHRERLERGEIDYRVLTTRDRETYEASTREPGAVQEGEAGTLRQRLYAARRHRQLSQADVGKLFGVSKVTVSKWEIGPELNEDGKVRGLSVPEELVPLVRRWIETGEPPTEDELARRRTRKTGRAAKE